MVENSFIASSLLVVVGFYIRLKILKLPALQKMQRKGRRSEDSLLLYKIFIKPVDFYIYYQFLEFLFLMTVLH
jgi:hypothetical protein